MDGLERAGPRAASLCPHEGMQQAALSQGGLLHSWRLFRVGDSRGRDHLVRGSGWLQLLVHHILGSGPKFAAARLS